MSGLHEDNRPPWLDHRLCQTNPVYVAEQRMGALEAQFDDDLITGSSTGQTGMALLVRELAARGGRIPNAILARFIRKGALPGDFCLDIPEERPGVIGLVVDRRSPLRLVLPLRPARLPWHVDPSLPFAVETIQDELVRLVHVAGLPSAGVIPERLGYAFRNPLGQRVKGNSMTVAALLAILDELSGASAPEFRAACALVELLPDGRLEPVECGRVKLEAALRECERLSLVVCHPRCTALGHLPEERLAAVWRVDSIAALATELHRVSLLAPLFRCAPLERAEAVRVRDRLRWLMQQEHRYREAAELGERLQDCPRVEPFDPAVWTDIARSCAEAARHYGQFTEALRHSQQNWSAVAAQGVLTSDDEEADAAAEYAAGQFDSHQFEQIPPLLQRWAALVTEEPRRFRPLTRVKVWNTLGRALVMLDRPEWEALFRQSLELNRVLGDHGNANRTLSYLVHGMLRAGRAREADVELQAAGWHRDPLPAPDPWLCRSLADVSRCVGDRWGHPKLDAAHIDADGPRHAFGLYCQAIARQAQRPPQEAVRQFMRAAAFMRAEAGDAACNICILFALLLDLAAVAHDDQWSGDGQARAWTDAVQALRLFLNNPPAAPLRNYYLPAVVRLPDVADAAAVEELLRRVPYF